MIFYSQIFVDNAGGGTRRGGGGEVESTLSSDRVTV